MHDEASYRLPGWPQLAIRSELFRSARTRVFLATGAPATGSTDRADDGDGTGPEQHVVRVSRIRDARDLDTRRRELLYLARFDHPSIPRVLDCGRFRLDLHGHAATERSGNAGAAGNNFLDGDFLDGDFLDGDFLDGVFRDVLFSDSVYVMFDGFAGRQLDLAFARWVDETTGGPGAWSRFALALEDIVAAIAYLGERELIHGDISPANILVSEDAARGARLIDFEFTGPSGDSSRRVRGTPGFVAPELLEGAPADRASDLYALGATIVAVMAGDASIRALEAIAKLPLDARARAIGDAVRSARPSIECPRELAEIVARLITSDPRERKIDCREILHALATLGASGDPPRGRWGPAPIIPLRAHETELSDAIIEAIEGRADANVIGVCCPEDESARSLIDIARIAASLAGARFYEIAFDPAGGPAAASLDAGALIARRQGSALVVALRHVELADPAELGALASRNRDPGARPTTPRRTEIERPPSPPVLIVALVEDGAPDAIDRCRRAMRGARSIETSPLSFDELRAWVRGRPVAVQAAALGDDDLRNLHELSGGLPTRVDAWLRLRALGRPPTASIGDPRPSSGSMLAELAAELPAAERSGLETLSILGSGETLEATARMLVELESPHADFDRLLDAGFLETRYGAGGSFVRWTAPSFAAELAHRIDAPRRLRLRERLDGADATSGKSPAVFASREILERAVDNRARSDDRAGSARAMLAIATSLQGDGEYHRALEYCARASRSCVRSADRSTIAAVYYRSAAIRSEQGELRQARLFADRAHEIAAAHGDRIAAERASMILARVALAHGRVAEALDRCRTARHALGACDPDLALEIDAREAEAVALTGRIAETRRLFESVLERARERDDSAHQITSLLHLARIAIEERAFRHARQWIDEALWLGRRSGMRRHRVETLIDASLLELILGDAGAAAPILDEAYALLEDSSFRDLVPRYFYARGRLALEVDSDGVDAALRYFERAVIESEHLGLGDLVWRVHAQFGRIDERAGRLDAARARYERARAVLDAMSEDLPRSRDGNGFFAPIERADVLRGLAGVAVMPLAPGSAANAPDANAPDANAPDANAPDEGARERPIVEQDLARKLLSLHATASGAADDSSAALLLDHVLDAVLGAVLDTLPAERAFVSLIGGDGAIAVRASRDLDGAEIADSDGKTSGSIQRLVVESGIAHLAGNASSAGSLPSARSIRNLRLKSILCVPLRCRGRVIGTVYVDHRHRRDAFDTRDLARLQLLADHAAIAISNLRLLDEERYRRRLTEEAQQAYEVSNIKLRSAAHKQSVRLAIARSWEDETGPLARLVGDSRAMRHVREFIRSAAGSKLPVLISGESGTGKELVARAIHGLSARSGRFVSESCGALPAALFESRLFGHEKGAFTGAVSASKGLVAESSGGTLFLDAIDDLDPEMQSKLSRVLEEGIVRPLGGEQSEPVELRIVASTTADLDELAAAGRFHRDLRYRVAVLSLRLPALRERRDDIPALVHHFLDRIAWRDGAPRKAISQDALRRLARQSWPGNVRELRNAVERLALVCGDAAEITLADVRRDVAEASAPLARADEPPGALRDERDRFEREYLRRVLALSGGSVRAAAGHARISRETFYRLLRKHGLAPAT